MKLSLYLFSEFNLVEWLILVQHIFLLLLLLFFPSLPKSLATTPSYCRTQFCLDCQAHIRKLGKASALQ